MSDAALPQERTPGAGWSYGIVIFFSVLFGAWSQDFLAWLEPKDNFGTVTPAAIPVTKEERGGKLFFSTVPPIDIKLRFMSRADIARRSSNAYAFTYIYRKPCEIIMPAGIQIVGMTYDWPYARFLDRTDGDVLAHEILHCLRGDWHVDNIGAVAGRIRP